MKNKSLRRSLLTSVVSLATCSTMFVGTTFAWFTDSVTSARNVIQSGNLDITLNYWDGDSFEEVGKNTKLFNDAARWEPGHTEVAYLEIANAGSLALKYQLAVNVFNETLGKTKDGAEIKLSDYLVFTVKEINANEVGTYDRKEAKEFAGTSTGLKAYKSEYTPLEKNGDADYVAMVIYMPETVQNEANHDGVNIPSIEMGVSLVATQMAYEEDSFNNEYDKDAPELYSVNGKSYNSAEEALNAAQSGDKVILSGITAPINVDKAIDLTISRATVQAAEGVNAMTISADATVKFDGANTFIGGKDADGISITNSAAPVLTGKTANLTVKGNNCVDGSKDVKIGGSGIGADENSSIVIKDLANLVAEGYGTAGFGIGGATKSVTLDKVNVEYVSGGFVQPKLVYDTSYGKSEPEGGSAIGSMTSGAQINIKNSTIVHADGGSKAAAIGARYHTGVTVNITDSNVTAFGGNASAGIGGSRVSSEATVAEQCNITITNSTVNATGGQFAAGIGSGYDTHCKAYGFPFAVINIDAQSKITAQGGQYGAGIGTGYHVAGLAGNIECEVKAKDGGYRADKYTRAQSVGFGVVDVTREGKDSNFYITYMGTPITIPSVELVQDKINNAQAGEKILLPEGYYDQLIVQNADGSLKNGLTIIGDKGAVVGNLNLNGSKNITVKNIAFDAAGAALSNNYYTNISFYNTASGNCSENVVIENCQFNGTATAGRDAYCPIISNHKSSHTRVANITVKDCEFNAPSMYCMSFFYTAKGTITVENNKFSNFYAYAVALNTYNSSDLIVKGNTFTFADFAHATSSSAIYSASRSETTNIINAKITGNTFTGYVGEGFNPGVIYFGTGTTANRYQTSNFTYSFSGNTFEGTFAGKDESTVKVNLP